MTMIEHSFLEMKIEVDGCGQPNVGVFSEKFLRHIRCFTKCRKKFSDTNKKTNYIIRLETARQIY
jgi:hypothetical protein